MLGTLTTDYNEGLNILKKINEIKIVKHFEKSYFTYGFKEAVYLYSSQEEKESHKKEMLSNGWTEVDGQSNIGIYSNLYEKRYIRVPCGIYEKSIESNYLFSDN